MMDANINPCPWCGKEARLSSIGIPRTGFVFPVSYDFIVVCNDHWCRTRGKRFSGGSFSSIGRNTAITSWNAGEIIIPALSVVLPPRHMIVSREVLPTEYAPFADRINSPTTHHSRFVAAIPRHQGQARRFAENLSVVLPFHIADQIGATLRKDEEFTKVNPYRFSMAEHHHMHHFVTLHKIVQSVADAMTYWHFESRSLFTSAPSSDGTGSPGSTIKRAETLWKNRKVTIPPIVDRIFSIMGEDDPF
jgi:hypothetical protein